MAVGRNCFDCSWPRAGGSEVAYVLPTWLLSTDTLQARAMGTISCSGQILAEKETEAAIDIVCNWLAACFN